MAMLSRASRTISIGTHTATEVNMMTTMFWILWFFIAFVVVLVAFTLRQESRTCLAGTFYVQWNQPVKWVLQNACSCGSFRGSTRDSDCKTTGTCPKVPTTTCIAKCLFHTLKSINSELFGIGTHCIVLAEYHSCLSSS